MRTTVKKKKKKKKKTIKNTNICMLNKMLLNNQQIMLEIKICIETNENENTTTPNLWDSIKALLRGRSIAIQENKRKTNKKPETREKSNK